MNSLPEIRPKFRPNQPAKEADHQLKSALKIKNAAHQRSLDWFGEILNRKLYNELGYSSINQYARQELGFSNSKIGDYIKLTKKLEKLPHLKQSLNSGQLGYTKGRLLTDVVDKNNEKQWLEFALKHPRKRVEEAVKIAKQNAKDKAAGLQTIMPQPKRIIPKAAIPVQINLEMTPAQFARYESLWEKIRKQRIIPSDKTEAILEIMASFLTEDNQNVSPRGENSTSNQPPAQIHIHHCPECESSIVQTSKGELEIGKTGYQRYQCDCQTSQPNKPNTTSIPPSIRRKVLARARHKCQTPGCNHTKFLEIHHIVPRSAGGSNDPSNLRCQCSACHRLIHTYGSGNMVKEPTEVYCWNNLAIRNSKCNSRLLNSMSSTRLEQFTKLQPEVDQKDIFL